METDGHKDQCIVTAPIERLHDQVLAPERHDLFLSALAVVHRKQRLTKEVAEQTAYLMMQTGDGDDNFHGWVRLAMWSRFNGCSVCRQVLAALESVEAVEELYDKYTVEELKTFRAGIEERATGLGWKRNNRAYMVGRDRLADRSDEPTVGLVVDCQSSNPFRSTRFPICSINRSSFPPGGIHGMIFGFSTQRGIDAYSQE